MKTSVSLTYLVKDVSGNIFLLLTAPDLFKLIFFDKFGGSEAFDTVLT